MKGMVTVTLFLSLCYTHKSSKKWLKNENKTHYYLIKITVYIYWCNKNQF